LVDPADSSEIVEVRRGRVCRDPDDDAVIDRNSGQDVLITGDDDLLAIGCCAPGGNGIEV
jgi:predicted nucleic acid-binding protein